MIGPAGVVAPHGDWLVCSQQSEDQEGHHGVIGQVPGSDKGKTVRSDDIVFDQRGEKQKYFGRNPASAATSNGRICDGL